MMDENTIPDIEAEAIKAAALRTKQRIEDAQDYAAKNNTGTLISIDMIVFGKRMWLDGYEAGLKKGRRDCGE